MQFFEQVERVGIVFLVFGGQRNAPRFPELTFRARGSNSRGLLVAVEHRKRLKNRVAVEHVEIHVTAARFHGVEQPRLVCDSEENGNACGRLFESFEQLVLCVRGHKVGAVHEIYFSVRKRFDGNGRNQILDFLNLDFLTRFVQRKDVGIVVRQHLVTLRALHTRGMRSAVHRGGDQSEKFANGFVVGGNNHIGVAESGLDILAEKPVGTALPESVFKGGSFHLIAPFSRRAETILLCVSIFSFSGFMHTKRSGEALDCAIKPS